MNYESVVAKISQEEGVEESTMMKTPCLRYKGAFLGMMSGERAACPAEKKP